MNTPIENEIAKRFGILPNFFRLASSDPAIAANLWGFAQFAYLDNPLPSLFKERLFVYLSRFCEIRYCIARHVGFLVGLAIQPAILLACHRRWNPFCHCFGVLFRMGPASSPYSPPALNLQVPSPIFLCPTASANMRFSLAPRTFSADRRCIGCA